MKFSRIIGPVLLIPSLINLQGCALLGLGEEQVEEMSQQEQQEQEDQDQEDNQEDQQENQSNEVANQIPSLPDGNATMTDDSMMANIANNNAAMLGSDGLGVPEGMEDTGNMANNMALPNEANMAGMEDLSNMMNESLAGSNIANSAAMEAGAAAPAAAAPGDAKVYYVLADGTELKDAPDGNTIGTLAKGDPLLISVEGDWGNAANRGYIQLSQLSSSAVGRTQETLAWQ